MSFPIHVAIFASGAGSNAGKIIDYFKRHTAVKIALVVCNKPAAGVLEIARLHDIPTLLIEAERFLKGDGYLEELKGNNIAFIVLAGFLLKIPISLIEAFPLKIINIHPALLPKYGGKNMYGARVHEAVITSGDRESGITIHFVDELYDNGAIIFQKKCTVDEGDTAASLAQKIHLLEYEFYPVTIEKVISEQFR